MSAASSNGGMPEGGRSQEKEDAPSATAAGNNQDDDLNALEELVPNIKEKTTAAVAEEQDMIHAVDSMNLKSGGDDNDDSNHVHHITPGAFVRDSNASSSSEGDEEEQEQTHPYESKEDSDKAAAVSSHNGFDDDDDNDSTHSKPRDARDPDPGVEYNAEFSALSSGQSLSTATQTQQQEVRMPMYLPTFKPATGCTNASDFIVRCFVARLRSGITVVKHGRSRWCKSRLRILHIHSDGRSLSWKPAQGEPTSSKRPPKLDLTTCLEVRHAWSPDPSNPMYTGTPILRQKCEAANAHKSFALIFAKRTVDITSVTADQCKVLMEGFSALCFRLQVANLAGAQKKQMPEDEVDVATTASNTLTNKSKFGGTVLSEN